MLSNRISSSCDSHREPFEISRYRSLLSSQTQERRPQGLDLGLPEGSTQCMRASGGLDSTVEIVSVSENFWRARSVHESSHYAPRRRLGRLRPAPRAAASKSQASTEPVKTKPVYTQLTLEFLEAVLGAQKTVQAEVLRICPDCGGRRIRPGVASSSCGFCRGTGQVLRSRKGELQHACMHA